MSSIRERCSVVFRVSGVVVARNKTCGQKNGPSTERGREKDDQRMSGRLHKQGDCYPLLLVELKIETGMCEEFGEALMQTVDVVQKEGPSALYAGLVPYLLQVISQHLLYFALLKSFG